MQHLISEQASHIIGLCGVVTYLLAYALLQAGVIGGNGYLYAGLNALAACMVMISLIHAFNIASLLIQISFVVISIVGMTRIALLTRWARFTAYERQIYSTQFPDLEAHLARKLLNAGTWVDIEEGTILAREGETLDRMTYLASGQTKIYVEGQFVGHRSANTFIGEVSFMDGSPASATVEVSAPVHAFVISTQALSQLQQRHPEIRLALTASFSANTRATLRVRTSEIVDYRRRTQS